MQEIMRCGSGLLVVVAAACAGVELDSPELDNPELANAGCRRGDATESGIRRVCRAGDACGDATTTGSGNITSRSFTSGDAGIDVTAESGALGSATLAGGGIPTFDTDRRARDTCAWTGVRCGGGPCTCGGGPCTQTSTATEDAAVGYPTGYRWPQLDMRITCEFAGIPP